MFGIGIAIKKHVFFLQIDSVLVFSMTFHLCLLRAATCCVHHPRLVFGCLPSDLPSGFPSGHPFCLDSCLPYSALLSAVVSPFHPFPRKLVFTWTPLVISCHFSVASRPLVLLPCVVVGWHLHLLASKADTLDGRDSCDKRSEGRHSNAGQYLKGI